MAKDVTPKQLRFSSNLLIDGKLSEEEEMVVAYQLASASKIIQEQQKTIDSLSKIVKNKIILCGPSAAGKTYLRNKMENKGFVFDVSYTSRPMRETEVDDKDYCFLSKQEFEYCIENGKFYEFIEYNGHYYGTLLENWKNIQCFIMETNGINKIPPKDRENCFIIYLHPPADVIYKRLKDRGWDDNRINERLVQDKERFKDFTNYDMKITKSDIPFI